MKELPFYNCEQICESTNNNEQLNVTYPSRVTDDGFKILESKRLHFVHLNACSIFHKIPELRLIAKEYSPAVISITETWLKKSDTDGCISIDTYSLLQRDRDSHARGVCMFIRNDLAFNPYPTSKAKI